MPKLLGEFLQEKQEPFVLKFYLLERGYRARTSPQKTSRFLKIKFVCDVFKKVVLHNGRKIKNGTGNGSREAVGANDGNNNEFTSMSSCSESEVTQQSDSSHEGKGEDCDKQQLSPISVLEETESQQASSLHQRKYSFKKARDGTSKKPISRSKSSRSVPKSEQCMEYYDQYSINKRALEQKRLLVDCVREVIENERRRDDGRGKQLKRILGAEELWKVVCENVWLWSQESVHEKNIIHLLKCDFMASLQESESASHQEEDEVSMEIGDAILDDIINEIITNLV